MKTIAQILHKVYYHQKRKLVDYNRVDETYKNFVNNLNEEQKRLLQIYEIALLDIEMQKETDIISYILELLYEE